MDDLSWLLAPWGAFGIALALLTVADFKTYGPAGGKPARTGTLTAVVASGAYALTQLGASAAEFAISVSFACVLLAGGAALLPNWALLIVTLVGAAGILTAPHGTLGQKMVLTMTLVAVAGIAQSFFRQNYRDYLFVAASRFQGFALMVAGSTPPLLVMAVDTISAGSKQRELIGYFLTCLATVGTAAWTLSQMLRLRLVRHHYRQLYEEYENRLQQLAAILPGIAFVQDVKGNYLEIWAGEKDLRQKGLDWDGKNLKDFFSEDKLQERLKLIQEVLRSGKPRHTVFEATLKDGTPWVRELSLLPLDHERVLTVSTDMRSWLNKTRRLQGIVEHSKELICIVAPDCRIDVMTPRALKELTGKDAQASCRGLFQDILSGPDKTLLEQHVCDVFLKKKEHANLEIRLLNTQSGKSTWVDVTVTAIAEDSSETPHALLMMRNSSHRQFLENLAKGAALALEGLMSPVAVIDDEEGRIEWANKAFLTLFELETTDSRKAPLDVLLTTSPTTKRMPSTLELLKNPVWKGQFVSKTFKTGRPVLHERRIRFVECSETNQVWHVVQFEEVEADKPYEGRDQATNTLTWTGLSRAISTSPLRHGFTAVANISIKNIDEYTTIGTDQANALLSQIAHCLKLNMPLGALLSRIDYAEFGLVWASFDEKSALQELEHVLMGLETAFEARHDLVYVSTNAGLAFNNERREPLDLLLHQARVARKEAEKTGSNQVLTFREEYAAQAKRERVLESYLRKALQIQSPGFGVSYQPKVAIATQQVVGFEALSRWHCEELNENISPSEFVRVAEKSSLIEKLTIFVLELVCRQLKQWQDEQYPLLPVAVNLSAQQICDPTLPERLIRILRKYSVLPRLVELEVTESAVMRNVQAAQQVLGQLRRLGFRVALDDFGTGYTNMHCLQALPLDAIKIDASFVQGIGKPRDEQICQGILTLAQGLSLDTIAEGVETEEQLRFLAQAGCTAYQGFLTAPALPPEEATHWLQRGQPTRELALVDVAHATQQSNRARLSIVR